MLPTNISRSPTPARPARILPCAFVLVGLVALVPWYPHLPDIPDLNSLKPDRSCIIAQAQISYQLHQYGTDIVWTYGPLGFLHHGLIWLPPAQRHVSIVLRLALTAVFALSLWKLGQRVNLPATGRLIWWFWLLALILVGHDSRHSFLWVAFPLLAAFEAADSVSGAQRKWPYALALASAITAMVKFTYFMYAIGVFGVLAVWQTVWVKIFPSLSLFFCVALAICWLGCGQSLWHLPAYIASGLDLASGYSSTMQKGLLQPYAPSDLLLFAICAATPLFGYLYAGIQRQAKGLLLTSAAAGLLVALSHKHAWGGNQLENATSSLILLALVYYAHTCSSPLPRGNYMMFASLVVCGLAAGGWLWLRHDGPTLSCLKHPASHAIAFMQKGSYFAAAISGDMSCYEKAYDSWRQRIRELARVDTTLAGTADYLGDGAGIVVPHDRLQYLPRPMFMSINAHTEKLAARNADFYRSERSPDYVFYDVHSIPFYPYDRFPTLSDGPALLELIRRYEATADRARFLVFSKRDRPATIQYMDRRVFEATWGQRINVAGCGDNEILWVSVDVALSSLGVVLDCVYKSPKVNIKVFLHGGEEFEYRLIPGMARAGFLLSPLLQDNSEVYDLSRQFASGRRTKPARPVRAIALTHEDGCGSLFDGVIQVDVSKLKVVTE